MGDELRIGYRDDLPFCNIDLAQMKPLKEPLFVKETTVLPKRTVCWVTVESNKSEGNVILPMGTGKGILLHVGHGRVEIPMLNDKDEDQQLIKGSSPSGRSAVLSSGAVVWQFSEAPRRLLHVSRTVFNTCGPFPDLPATKLASCTMTWPLPHTFSCAATQSVHY
ncbi:hypothetical protein HPB50_010435 [Hyalomma asiaticum]|uniref:Uncharacterized protein n=1 Tax=Hyalomma asiaticum TaxID=266040 RepID=A0ACB7T7S0_HYAAI|nr:hypothetical protein HPB50_010435 [Hyalomma asiaticum]